MCTVSWSNQPVGYTLFFNRDESGKRQDGIPPKVETYQSTRFICPRDPVGKGTWLLVNEYGLTLGLLNFYEAQINYHPVTPKSRGQLPLEHAHCKQLEEVETKLAQSDLSPYPPFHLLAVDKTGTAILITWDGTKQSVSHPKWEDLPITTSSFLTSEVVDRRKQLFDQNVLQSMDSVSAMEAFHTDKQPSPETHAVLMTRPNAKTVSVTRIDVYGPEIKMSYRSRQNDTTKLDPPVTQSIIQK
jgi:hypothetical protein